MEELNRHQLILLVLLISFVTSIATGIVTVTLMDQASPGVTQTINRVVERTIERVVTGEPETTTVVKEVPVIVTEQEMITGAFNRVSSSVFHLAKSTDEGFKSLGSATLMDSGGKLLTLATLFPETEEGQSNEYFIFIEENQAFKVETGEPLSQSIVWLEVVQEDRADFLSAISGIVPPKRLNDSKVIVGQTVIGVGAPSQGNHSVAVGIVSQWNKDRQIIRTNASGSDNLGGPLLDIEGRVIGFNLRSGEAMAVFDLEF